jgi:hypothetical protein
MSRNITITEGEPDPHCYAEISFVYVSEEWTVAFKMTSETEGCTETSWHDWNQNDLTDWLINRLDPPMTASKAIEDDRVYVSNKNHEYRDPEISMFNGTVARATYNDELFTQSLPRRSAVPDIFC